LGKEPEEILALFALIDCFKDQKKVSGGLKKCQISIQLRQSHSLMKTTILSVPKSPLANCKLILQLFIPPELRKPNQINGLSLGTQIAVHTPKR
jgi:hypothetical protein